MPCSPEALKSISVGGFVSRAPLLRFFEALGALGFCCLCDVVCCGGGGGAREGMHFSQSKNARLLKF